MTPEQIALVQQSLEEATSQADDFVARFYQRLFELDPATRTLFSTDFAVLREKFFTELDAIVGALGSFGDFMERAQSLGRRHHDFGVTAKHYAEAREALLWALSITLASRFTSEVRDAWQMAYNLVAEVMMANP